MLIQQITVVLFSNHALLTGLQIGTTIRMIDGEISFETLHQYETELETLGFVKHQTSDKFYFWQRVIDESKLSS